MTRILANAVLTYQQEGDNLLFVVAPAILLGPIGAFAAATSAMAAVVALPTLALLYVVGYSASVRAAGLVHDNLSPDAARAHLGVLRKTMDIARLAGPGVLMFVAVTGGALAIADMGQGGPALVLFAFGASTFFLWAARHAYDLPLVLVHGLGARDASRAGLELFRSSVAWTILLAAAVTSPLLLAALASWGLAGASAPAAGAAVFAAALAVWLPLPAFSLTNACSRMLGETE